MTARSDSEAAVFLIDDDDAVRASVLKTLRDAGLRARAFGSGHEFFAHTSVDDHACVVTDLRMAGMDGFEVVRRLQETGRSVWPVIVLTGHADVTRTVQMMKAGVVDFIEKPFDPDALIASVRHALAGLNDVRSRQAEQQALRQKYELLTDRERQIFAELIAGGTNKDIAGKYDFSVRMVEVHRANVMRKIQADSLAALVRFGVSLNIIAPNDDEDCIVNPEQGLRPSGRSNANAGRG